ENPSTTTTTPYTGSVITNSEASSTESPSTTTTTAYTGSVITDSEPPSTGTPSRSTGSTGTISATTIITSTDSTTTTSTTTSSTSVQTSDTTTGSTSTASTTTTTSSTPVTLTTTTTTPIPPVAVGFSVAQSSFEITHMFNMASFPNPDCTNVCSATCESDLRKYLNDCLKPKLSYVGCIPETCLESPCRIRYTMSYDGYGNVDQGDILHYLNCSTKCVFTSPTVILKQNASCSGGSILQYQNDCKYCGDGNGHLCATFDESKCIIRNDDISYACHSQQGSQVLGTAPTRILNTDLPRSHPNDYVYQERIPQYNTFPSRNQAYNRRNLPPSYFNETDDRLGILRDLINEYNLERGANPRVNITRDVDDDDEIYV
ncbi:unnamed protein product, partial [Adineta steineri]